MTEKKLPICAIWSSLGSFTMTWFGRARSPSPPPPTGVISLPKSAAAMGGPRALLLLLITLISASSVTALKEKVPCIENGKFYRNPNRHPDYVWSQTECAKYYLCIEDEVKIQFCSSIQFYVLPIDNFVKIPDRRCRNFLGCVETS